MSEVETYQAAWELEQLVAIVERLEPKRILEVGAWHGGTLWHWLQHATQTVVVIDDEMRMAETWEQWVERFGADLVLLQGRSQEGALIDKATACGPYDFVFIDADHTYAAVKSDWENYGPLGRVVAFHDILPRPSYGVSELWAMLKVQPGVRYVEIVQNEVLPGNEGRCGIGVLWT